MKTFKIKFLNEFVNSEELREVIEDNLGVEVFEIEEIDQEAEDRMEWNKKYEDEKGVNKQ